MNFISNYFTAFKLLLFTIVTFVGCQTEASYEAKETIQDNATDSFETIDSINSSDTIQNQESLVIKAKTCKIEINASKDSYCWVGDSMELAYLEQKLTILSEPWRIRGYEMNSGGLNYDMTKQYSQEDGNIVFLKTTIQIYDQKLSNKTTFNFLSRTESSDKVIGAQTFRYREDTNLNNTPRFTYVIELRGQYTVVFYYTQNVTEDGDLLVEFEKMMAQL